jgi:ydcL (lambda integrase-like, N-terminal,DNA breaking-rejoining enzyme, catalytic core)
MNFEKLSKDFFKWKSLNLKYNTFKDELYRFNKQILPFFKNYNIEEINHNIYMDFKTYLNEKNYSYSYKSSIHSLMCGIFDYYNEFYTSLINIPKKVKGFKKSIINKNYDIWDHPTYKKFISVVDNFTYKVFFRLLYFTGIRLGEALALTWNDFSGNDIYINKSLSKVYKEDERVITTPKTANSIRFIQLDKGTKKELLTLKEKALHTHNYKIDNLFIFGGIKPLSRTTIKRYKDKYSKLANVPNIKFHNFRHSHATLLSSGNVLPAAVSSRLGHSSVNITLNIYTHLFKNDETQVLNFLNTLEA